MTDWAEIESVAPDFARRVRARFAAGMHHTLATLRADGSPRISGTEVRFDDGQVGLGMMAASVKLADVARDARVAIHSATMEPPGAAPADWAGDAKLAGRLIQVHTPADGPEPDSGSFVLEIGEVVLTHLDSTASQLVVESWHPGHGYRVRQRD